jgi:polar amino acid transport system substrate-binding protein
MFSRRLSTTFATVVTSCTVLLSVAIPAHACTSAIPADRLVSPGRLALSTNPTLPPLQYVDGDGQLKGMNIELGHELAKRLCVEVDFIRMDFPAMIPALKAGRFDGIDTGMFWTEERSHMMYTVPYAVSTIDMVVNPDSKLALADAQALRGHSIGVEADSYQERWLRERARESAGEGGKPIEIHAFTTASDVMAALRAGQVDVAVLPSYAAAAIVKRKQARMALPGQGNTQTTLAFRQRAVAEAVAKALDGMRADGSYAKLLDSYGMTKLPDAHISVRGTGPA